MENFIQILKFPVVKPIVRLTVLNRDETVNYVIPNEDIIEDSVVYDEKYVNGQRKNLSFKLINIYDRSANSSFAMNNDYQIF
jgi:hypothetical protein